MSYIFLWKKLELSEDMIIAPSGISDRLPSRSPAWRCCSCERQWSPTSACTAFWCFVITPHPPSVPANVKWQLLGAKSDVSVALHRRIISDLKMSSPTLGKRWKLRWCGMKWWSQEYLTCSSKGVRSHTVPLWTFSNPGQFLILEHSGRHAKWGWPASDPPGTEAPCRGRSGRERHPPHPIRRWAGPPSRACLPAPNGDCVERAQLLAGRVSPVRAAC